jgi:hypothetical protein
MPNTKKHCKRSAGHNEIFLRKPKKMETRVSLKNYSSSSASIKPMRFCANTRLSVCENWKYG